MLNFCTLFDSNYIRQGLALYQSLQKHSNKFHLYIFAFDQKCEEILKKMLLKNVTIISLKEFEDAELLKIKPTRSKGEYCWTCTSSTILYVLKNFSADACTYLDADTYFFADPKILLDELKAKSVLITNHNYAPEYDQSQISGKYCVQFMTFKNNESALEVLNWWRNACLEWCYNRVENGKFGDQKYLDAWLEKFDCVYELQNQGGGVAPWNCTRYDFYLKNNQIYISDKINKQEFPLVFYHFHSLKFLQKNILQLASKNYKLSSTIENLIYRPYLQNIDTVTKSTNIKFTDTKIPLIKKLKIKFSKTHKNLINKKYFLKNGTRN